MLAAGMTYLRAGEPERAAELCGQAVKMGSNSGAQDCILSSLLAQGNREGALQALAEWLPSTDPPSEVLQRIESAPDPETALLRSLRWRFHLLFVALRQPFPAGAEKSEADDERPVWASPLGELWSSPGRVAVAAAQAGGADAALEWLQKAHAQRSPSFVRWAGSPVLAGLHQRPEFQALLSQSPLSPSLSGSE
jgi:hypothetical protein